MGSLELLAAGWLKTRFKNSTDDEEDGALVLEGGVSSSLSLLLLLLPTSSSAFGAISSEVELLPADASAAVLGSSGVGGKEEVPLSPLAPLYVRLGD